jgi:hypothetical protein
MKIYCGDVDFLYNAMKNQIEPEFHKYMMPFEEFRFAIESHSLVFCQQAVYMLNIGVLSERVKALMKGQVKPIVIDFMNNTATLN